MSYAYRVSRHPAFDIAAMSIATLNLRPAILPRADDYTLFISLPIADARRWHLSFRDGTHEGKPISTGGER